MGAAAPLSPWAIAGLSVLGAAAIAALAWFLAVPMWLRRRGLVLRLEGKPSTGAKVTAIVTDRGLPAKGAAVAVNGVPAGQTDAKGQLLLQLPDKPGEARIKATLGKKGCELSVQLLEPKKK